MRHLIEAADLTHAREALIELDTLSRFERPLPVMTAYDGLLGKTHLLTGLAVAARRQKRRVRFASAAALINEMVEAKHSSRKISEFHGSTDSTWQL